MPTNAIFSKDVLCNIITDNLDTLCQCIEGTIYQQWTAIILLMQFIEYVLKYKIQCAKTYTKKHRGKVYPFPRTHEIGELYKELTEHDRDCIEKWFSKLMEDRKSKYPDRKTEYPDRFCSIQKFAERYNTSYTYWRYDRLEPNFNLNENSKGYEKYFYLADTVTVLRALIKSTDLNIDTSALPNEDVLVNRFVKKSGAIN